jgi:hypothetical protein
VKGSSKEQVASSQHSATSCFFYRLLSTGYCLLSL